MRGIIVIVLLTFTVSVQAQQSNDEAEIKEALYNYIDAFYQADTSKAFKSVAKDLAKRGYYNRDGKYVDLRMTYPQLVKMAQTWKNNQQIGPDSPRKITIFEILDQTASAKVEAKWGIDYLHLAKLDGTWTIVNVVWQSYPANK